jgi:methyl-accepting chemotaxis protein
MDMDNRRKTIVINKPFQYQHSLMIAALAVLLLNGFLIARLLFPGDYPLGLNSGQITGLAILELLLLAGVWYACLQASHRIAGPVYVFSREIQRLGQGDLGARIVLREKDNFRPEAERMNQSIDALRERIATLKALSEELQQARQGGGDVGPVAEKLSTELSGFNLGN